MKSEVVSAVVGALGLAVIALSACKSEDEPSSSSTHWVTCVEDADCVRVGASACAADRCIDSEGQAFEVEESGSVSTTGVEVDPTCDPTGPVERDSELRDVLLVARAGDGTTYVVDEDESNYRVYRSEKGALVPMDVRGAGESDSVVLSVNDADARFTLLFEPRDEPTRAAVFDGELEDDPDFDPRRPDWDAGQALEVLDESAADDLEVMPLASATWIEYRAWSSLGHEMLVVRPDREFEYEYLRMFYSDEAGEPLIERRVTEVLRQKDGGSTQLNFTVDGQPAQVYFPVRFEDGTFAADAPGTLTLADESIELLRAGDAPNELSELEYWCATDEREGWRLLSEVAPKRAAGTPCTFGEECASGICFGAGCGPGEGSCAEQPQTCPLGAGEVCDCDGVTRSFGCDFRWSHSGACEDAEMPAESDDLDDERAASGGVDEDDAGAGGDEQTPVRTSTGVEVHDLDGTWVFTHEAMGSGAAALGGFARIDDGCLFVGDSIVIWHAAVLAEVEDVVSDVSNGESVQLRFGGGGLTLDEGSTLEDFPIEVVERCDTRTILYQGGAIERVE